MKTCIAFIFALCSICSFGSVTKARYGSLGGNDMVVVDVQAESGVDTNAVRAIAEEESLKAVAPLSKEMEDIKKSNSNTTAIVNEYVAFVDGSNVTFVITNYLSGSYNINAGKFKIRELRDGQYNTVYDSREEIRIHLTNAVNTLTANFNQRLLEYANILSASLDLKADKDWGKYTSAGGLAPSNTTYLTSPHTVFAGGMEYERVSVALGTICILTNHGAPTYTQGDEGTFKFQDDGGTNYFGFAKTDSYTIGCNTDNIEVSSDGGLVTLTYNITMSGVPCIWYTTDLVNSQWVQLNLSDGTQAEGAPVVVSWEQNPEPDTEVCYINTANLPAGFFKATIEVAGSAKFMTNMPADFSGGVLCTDGITRIQFVNDNGTVKMEVVP